MFSICSGLTSMIGRLNRVSMRQSVKKTMERLKNAVKKPRDTVRKRKKITEKLVIRLYYKKVSEKNIPRFLYKYCEVNPYTLSNLVNSQCYASSREDLNYAGTSDSRRFTVLFVFSTVPAPGRLSVWLFQ